MKRRTFLRAGAAGLVTTAASGAVAGIAGPLAAAEAAPQWDHTVARGLDIPWGLDFLPDGSALVTERDNARVLRVTPSGTVSVVGEVPGVEPYGEGGLLGLAVSPSYADDQRVYLYYSTSTENRVAWTTYDGQSLGPLTDIVTGIPRAKSHNGGALRFATWGTLYVSCGDASQGENAQDRASLGGKVLRIDRDGNPRPGNPFNGTDRAGDPRILTFGHRNPQGLGFAANGDLWEAELGKNTWDEVNQIIGGSNYGWPRVEGTDGPGGWRDPLVQWNPDDCSPSGLEVVGNFAYVCGLKGESLWRVGLYGQYRATKQRYFEGRFGRLRNVKRAPDGTLWVTTSNGNGTDKIYAIARY